MARHYMDDCERDIRECPECGGTFTREDMTFTRDCQGIPFRLVCWECYDRIMSNAGYDGEYYTSEDECLDYDY